MSLKVLRVKNSGYFPTNFNELESSRLKLEYALGDFDNCEDIVLITNTDTSMSELKKISKKHNIKLIIHPNSGFDNFTSEIIDLGVPVLLGSSIRAQAVCDYAISSLISHFHLSHQLKWCRDSKLMNRKLISDLKVKVYGYGHVGRLLDKQLSPLINCLDFIDPYEGLKSEKSLSEYDAIILACSLNSKNHKMIDQKLLRVAKRDLLLINPARGPLVDWSIVSEFPEMSFALDVFPQEPFELGKYQTQNLYLTSHLAGCSQHLIENILNFEEMIINDFQNHEVDFNQKYKKIDIRNRYQNGMFI